jgi:tetratricopeptide (TPR) repeat protein
MAVRFISAKCQNCGAELDQDRFKCRYCGAVSVGVALSLARKEAAARTEDYLRHYPVRQLGADIDDASRKRIGNAVADVFAAGGSYRDTVRAVEKAVDGMTEPRAEMIARTVLNDVYCQTMLASAKEGGDRLKVWAPDGECCEEICRPNVDAGPIPLDAPFPSGHQAPAGHLGCDCSIEFVKAEELSEWVKRAAAKAANAAARRVVDLHFVYHNMIELNYRDRNRNPDALAIAIDACRKQIALAPQAAEAFRREWRVLPRPLGFWQLAVILEKQGNYAEAITLATQALHQGWAGDWEKRIARCNKRLASRTSTVR